MNHHKNFLGKDEHTAKLFLQKIEEFEKTKRNIRKDVDQKYKDLAEEKKEQQKWWHKYVINKLKEEIKRIDGQIYKFKRYHRMASGKKVKEQIAPEDVKHVSIKQILGEPVKSISKRNWYKCPLHNENTPSFCHYEKNNSFYCYGCHEGGDVIALVMKLHKLTFKEALKYLS